MSEATENQEVTELLDATLARARDAMAKGEPLTLFWSLKMAPEDLMMLLKPEHPSLPLLMCHATVHKLQEDLLTFLSALIVRSYDTSLH